MNMATMSTVDNSRMVLHAAYRAYNSRYEDLYRVEPPVATSTYNPLPHWEMVNIVLDEAKNQGMELVPSKVELIGTDGVVTEEEVPVHIALTNDSQRLFFNAKFRSPNNDYYFSVGGRNSYDKSMAAGVVAGNNNRICDNTLLSGQYSMLKRHTSNVDFDREIRAAFIAIPGQLEKFLKSLENLKANQWGEPRRSCELPIQGWRPETDQQPGSPGHLPGICGAQSRGVHRMGMV